MQLNMRGDRLVRLNWPGRGGFSRVWAAQTGYILHAVSRGSLGPIIRWIPVKEVEKRKGRNGGLFITAAMNLISSLKLLKKRTR